MARRWSRRASGVTVIAAFVLIAAPFAHRHYVRHVQANFRTVVEGQVYRSGQPSPDHLRKWKKEYGIRSIINLRGTGTKDYPAEKAAADELGLKLIDLEWSARRIPGPQAIRSFLDALAAAERPVLIHCAEGIDRSGAAAAIAAMRVAGVNYATAMKQLSSKYRNRKGSDAGVVGLFHRYEDRCTRAGDGTGGWTEFQRWVAEIDRD